MNKQEELTVRQAISRLRSDPFPEGSSYRPGEPRCSPEVHAALTGPARLYLDTWVIGALECLLPESRDLRLAVSLSQ